MLLKIIKFIKGYVRIRVCGYSPERFLNLCCSHDILIWDLNNCGDTYEMYMSVRAFRRLKPIVRKTKTKVRIVGRYGLPFFMYRYRKRKMFFAGIVLGSVLIYILSLFVWDIQFEGNSVRTAEVLMEYFESKNLHHGMSKKDVDCAQIEKMLRNEFDDIIWASVELKGTRLVVHVQESLDVSDGNDIDENTPTDLCAKTDGVIERIITRAGTPLVEAGTPVSAGAVLVQGRMEITGDDGTVKNYRYCAADADIYIRTVCPYEDSFSMTYEDKKYVGEEQNGYYIRTFDRKWKLDFWNRELTGHCEIVVEEKQLHLWNNFYLPFYWGNQTKKYYEKVEKVYSKEEAEQIAQKKIQQFCDDLQKKGVQIVQNNVTIHVDESTCKASGNVEIIERTDVRAPTEVLEVQQEEANEHNGTDS